MERNPGTSEILVDARDLKDLGKRLSKAAVSMEREVGVAMMRSISAVQTDTMVAVPVDTGALRQSLTAGILINRYVVALPPILPGGSKSDEVKGKIGWS